MWGENSTAAPPGDGLARFTPAFAPNYAVLGPKSTDFERRVTSRHSLKFPRGNAAKSRRGDAPVPSSHLGTISRATRLAVPVLSARNSTRRLLRVRLRCEIRKRTCSFRSGTRSRRDFHAFSEASEARRSLVSSRLRNRFETVREPSFRAENAAARTSRDFHVLSHRSARDCARNRQNSRSAF